MVATGLGSTLLPAMACSDSPHPGGRDAPAGSRASAGASGWSGAAAIRGRATCICWPRRCAIICRRACTGSEPAFIASAQSLPYRQSISQRASGARTAALGVRSVGPIARFRDIDTSPAATGHSQDNRRDTWMRMTEQAGRASARWRTAAAAALAPRQSRLVAGAAEPREPQPAFAAGQPDGRGVRLRRGVQDPRPRRGDPGPARPDDRFAGLVAGRFRPLRRPVHPPGLAQRRHLPHHRRPRRRRRRAAALRAAQQLAGQRQPRQGAPPAVADQAEIRPQALLGRPLRPRRQRRARIDGLQDLRLRRRPRRHLGAGRALLGSRRHLARRRALQRRAPAARARSARCRWA